MQYKLAISNIIIARALIGIGPTISFRIVQATNMGVLHSICGGGSRWAQKKLSKLPDTPDTPDNPSLPHTNHRHRSKPGGDSCDGSLTVDGPQYLSRLRVFNHVLPQQVVVSGILPCDITQRERKIAVGLQTGRDP